MKLATASLDKTVVIARIKAEGTVAVIRTDSIERALGAANAVIAGGFRAIEITYSFNGATEVIDAARELQVAIIPGAFTPTEIYTAYSLGADIVKIFPAVRYGPEYLRALRGPLPQIPIMPTSGVDATNVAEWFRAGA